MASHEAGGRPGPGGRPRSGAGLKRRYVLTAAGGGLVLGGALVGLSILNAREEEESRPLITAPGASASLSPTPATDRVVAVTSGSASSISAPTEVSAPTPAPVLAADSSPPISSGGLAVHEKGNPNAAVTVLDFSSYTCPHCREFALTTEPTLDKLYVATGRILFSFRHSPLDGAAYRASEAVESAGAQGNFWGFHHELMDRQPLLTLSRYSDPSLIAIATDLGLDTETFTIDLNSGKYRAKIDADIGEAIQRQVRAVPTFFINGEQIQGNQGQLILDTIESHLTQVDDAR